MVYYPCIPSTPDLESGMKIHLSLFVFAAASTLIVISADADEPEPTPTPRPTTLAAYAETISLRRPESIETDGRLTLSTEDIAELARGGALTEGRIVFGKRPASSAADAREKAKWQSRVGKQKAVIEKLVLEVARIEKAIDLLEDGRLTARALARLEKSKLDLEFAREKLHRARLEFTKIIREARLQGAEPGWFR